MMRKTILTGIALAAVAISSCDEDTGSLGNSLTSSVDKFTIMTDTFDVTTRSIKADSILSRSDYTYLGKIKDPETGSYITCSYMTQFNILEKDAYRLFQDKDSIKSRDANNLPQADSCFVSILVNQIQGDSLAAMQLTLYELDEAITQKRTYYSNFDPEERKYIRQGANAIRQNKIYSVCDLTESDSLRNVLSSKDYYQEVEIALNKPYTDENGITYNNYGTYIMRKYYDNPDFFKNANTFTRNVCPGFYIKSSDGHGVIMEVAFTQLSIHYTYKNGGPWISTSRPFNSTKEVLQTTNILNDKEDIQQLVNIDTCTYLKTPAGIYTEVTLPIEEIKNGRSNGSGTHVNDTISSAQIIFTKMRQQSDLSESLLEQNTSLLMVEKDSLYSFFENNYVPDYNTAYLATYNSSQKTYAFNNISNMINRMWARRSTGGENWNKAVLMPVRVTTTSSTTSSATTTSSVTNEMKVSSVRLVGGSRNTHAPIKISIIYNNNK